MWQEIAVGLMVAASAFFIGMRFWNSFRAARTGSTACGCGCSGCEQGLNSPSGLCDRRFERAPRALGRETADCVAVPDRILYGLYQDLGRIGLCEGYVVAFDVDVKAS